MEIYKFGAGLFEVHKFGAGLFGFGYLFYIILDLFGVERHIPEKFRGHPEVKIWIKKRIIPEAMVSIGALVLLFLSDRSIYYQVVGYGLTLIGLIGNNIVARVYYKRLSDKQ